MDIAFLGTGIMGRPMVLRLLKAGHHVVVFNRTQSKAHSLLHEGALAARDSATAIESAQVIFLMLADARAIENLLFGHEKIDFHGRTIIQMGTISPAESLVFARRIKAGGGNYCECPVLGSRQEVENGKLILMFGGTLQQFKKWAPLLRDIGKNLNYVGLIGKAAAIKLGFNQMIASLGAGFSLSFAYVKKFGVDTSMFMSILSQSAVNAPMFAKKLPRILKHNYNDPNFSTEHMLKDVRLFIESARRLKLNPASIEGVRKILEKTNKGTLKHKDYISLYERL